MEFTTSTGDTVFVYQDWYVVEGGSLVNKAPFDTQWQDGIDVETIEDVDCFTWMNDIDSLDELITAVEY